MNGPFAEEYAEAYPDLGEMSALQTETSAMSHPLLGPGRRVSRSSQTQEFEASAGPSHALLGPGRRVSRAALSAERELGELEIVGADERVRVSNTLAVPFRWICCLELFFPDPDDPSSFLQFVGSGTLVGSRSVLTAGHCLYYRVRGSRGTQALVEVARIRVSPGRNGTRRPLGFATSQRVRYPASWRSSLNFRFDYGIITLKSPIGAKRFASLGGLALGYWSSRDRGAGTRIRPRERAFLQGKPLNISGYPADKPSGTQWRAFGHVTHSTPRASSQLIYYDLDTCGGHSGSPVWLRWRNFRNLVAIHTGPCIPGTDCSSVPGASCFPGGQRYTSNRGVLITARVLSNVKSWMSA